MPPIFYIGVIGMNAAEKKMLRKFKQLSKENQIICLALLEELIRHQSVNSQPSNIEGLTF